MKIEDYLMAEGISAAELARRIGCNRQQVSSWIQGTARPSPRYMGIIRRVTGDSVQPNDFFPGEVNPVAGR